MKKLLTLVLTLVALAGFTSLGVAQQKAGENSVEKPTQGKLPFVGKQQLMTGKVTQANNKDKTFTVIREVYPYSVTFSAAKLKVLPKVGEIVDITYSETPGGPMEATTINSTKSATF